MSKIETYLRQYTSCFRFNYNRLYDSKGEVTEKELRQLRSYVNNIDNIKSWLYQCSIKDAIQTYKSAKKHRKPKNNPNYDPTRLVFGGKKNFKLYCQNKIDKEEFLSKRIRPVYSIGEKQFANRIFKLEDDLSVTFKPDKDTKIRLVLTGIGNRKSILSKLFLLQEERQIGITYKLDRNYVYISYDESVLDQKSHSYIENRILAVDLNPNYIGWSIVDWKSSSDFKVIESGCYDLSSLYKKDMRNGFTSTERIPLNNRRKHNLIHMCKHIVDLAIHYKVEIVAMEELNIKSSDKGKGRRYNRQCNNMWNRSLIEQQISKHCYVNNLKFRKVIANYSSYAGNIIFRGLDLPDMCLASIEIGRRAYEFVGQYEKRNLPIRKNIVYLDIQDFYHRYAKSLEEFSISEDSLSLNKFIDKIKTLKLRYRVPFNQVRRDFMVCKLRSNKLDTRIIIYNMTHFDNV